MTPDPQPIGVFVLTLRATAGPANSQPDGRRYTILAFAKGEFFNAKIRNRYRFEALRPAPQSR